MRVNRPKSSSAMYELEEVGIGPWNWTAVELVVERSG